MTPQENDRISHSSNRMCQNAHLLLSIMNELIHFLSTLNAFHFLLIESLLVFHLQKLDFTIKGPKFYTVFLPSNRGLYTWVQEYRSTAVPFYSVHKCCHLVINHGHPMCVWGKKLLHKSVETSDPSITAIIIPWNICIFNWNADQLHTD